MALGYQYKFVQSVMIAETKWLFGQKFASVTHTFVSMTFCNHMRVSQTGLYFESHEILQVSTSQKTN